MEGGYGITPAEAVLMNGQNKGDDFLSGNGIIILILFFLIFGFTGNGFGGGNAASNALTQAELQRGFDQQSTAMNIQAVQNGLATTAAATARGFSENMITSMQNANQLGNSITQGTFALQNAINQSNYDQTFAMMNGFNGVNAGMAELGNQMQRCCCELKTQMLEDKYERTQNELTQAQMSISNSVQTSNILSALGNWYAQPSVNPYTCFNGGCGC